MEPFVELPESFAQELLEYLHELKHEWLWKAEEFRHGHRKEFLDLKNTIETLEDVLHGPEEED